MESNHRFVLGVGGWGESSLNEENWRLACRAGPRAGPLASDCCLVRTWRPCGPGARAYPTSHPASQERCPRHWPLRVLGGFPKVRARPRSPQPTPVVSAIMKFKILFRFFPVLRLSAPISQSEEMPKEAASPPGFQTSLSLSGRRGTEGPRESGLCWEGQLSPSFLAPSPVRVGKWRVAVAGSERVSKRCAPVWDLYVTARPCWVFPSSLRRM